jgi:hypothetical protein
MFVVSLLMIAGIGLLFMGEQARVYAVRTSQDTASRLCADAGLEKAISVMNTRFAAGTLCDDDLPASIGETLPAAEGAFSYRITKNLAGDYIATSVGARGDFRRTIVATLYRKTKSYFDYGVMSLGACNVSPGMFASAYDSQDASATGLKIQMGTLSTAGIATVVTKPGSVVEGDLFCGVGGDPAATISAGGTVTGSMYALTEAPEVIYPTIPAGLPAKPDLHTNGATVTLTPSSSGVYSTFCVDNGGTKGKLVISGGTVTMGVTSFMKLDNDAEILVKEGSTLILYVGCNISSMNGASITYEGAPIDPTHIQIYGTGTGSPQTWAIKAKNEFTGIIYAPNANISINPGRNFYGAIVANNAYMDIASGFGFYYDVNLQRATNVALNGPAGYAVKRWSESMTGQVPDWAY